jgi:hypothetical protein
MLKSKGLSWLPWGIPLRIWKLLSPIVICEFFIKKFSRHSSTSSKMGRLCIFCNNLSWGTVSKALFKSMNKIPVRLFRLYIFYLLFWNLHKFTSVPSPFMNPVWDLWIFWLTYSFNLPIICSSISFLYGPITVMGLRSFTVGYFGATLLINIILPCICFRKFCSEFTYFSIFYMISVLFLSIIGLSLYFCRI